MHITYFQRRPLPGLYSIENIFNDVRTALPRGISYTVSLARFPSLRFLPRVYNALEAARRQSGINHITGDIHYVSFFLKKKRTLLTIHDCITLERLRGLPKVVFFFLWYWLPEKRSQIISVVSQSTKRELLNYVHCDPDKIRVVPCCVSPAFELCFRAFNRQKPLILQVGTWENKNLLRLISALQGISCHLHIIGNLTAKQIEALGHYCIEYSNVVALSRGKVVEQYRACDMVVFPSTYEGFGLPILEAQATGRPIVTSNILSMPEVAGGGACLVDPFSVESIREGVLRVIHDADYRETTVQRGLRNVEHFQPRAVASKYVELYEELIAGS